jgi:Bacterial SH3 domain
VVEEDQPAGDAPGVQAPLMPRQLAAQHRRRRRRRRRAFGVLVFVAVAVGVFAAAYFSLVGTDSSKDTAGRRPPLSTTTTAPRPAGPYRVVTGVNVREGPATTYPSVGTVETGHVVFVACVIDGEPVEGPIGPSTKWVRLAGFGPQGYVTAQYVNMGSDLDIPGKIPVCGGI